MTLDELKGLKSNEIMSLIRGGKSIISELGCEKLKRGSKVMHFLANWVIGTVRRRTDHHMEATRYRLKASREARKMLRKIAPFKVTGYMPEGYAGAAIGFNHPSLGEIVRIMIMTTYRINPNHRILFPVKMSWYEALCCFEYDLATMFGIYIVPIVTPKLRDDVVKINPAAADAIKAITNTLNFAYLKHCQDFAKRNDFIILAPCATRQSTVFKSHQEIIGNKPLDQQSMAYLATSLTRAKIEEFNFVPLCVIPPKHGTRGFNPWRKYELVFSDPFTLSEAMDYVKNHRTPCGQQAFDHEFLWRIAIIAFADGSRHLAEPDSWDAPSGLASRYCPSRPDEKPQPEYEDTRT